MCHSGSVQPLISLPCECSGKMVEALHSYMPEGDASSGAPRWRRGRVAASAAEVATLFEVHPLVIEQMVRRCVCVSVYLSFYVSMTFTGIRNSAAGMVPIRFVGAAARLSCILVVLEEFFLVLWLQPD